MDDNRIKVDGYRSPLVIVYRNLSGWQSAGLLSALRGQFENRVFERVQVGDADEWVIAVKNQSVDDFRIKAMKMFSCGYLWGVIK
jgi:hypothetical protein